MKVHRNCCGLNVHKQTIAACLIREDESGNTHKEKRLFGTTTQDLRELAQWLREAEVSAFARSNEHLLGTSLECAGTSRSPLCC